MKVYLADLGHDKIIPGSDSYPLGIGCLAAYGSEYVKSREPITYEVFERPGEFLEAINSDMPEVVGLANFSWNYRLGLEFARYIKERSPQTLTLMGGANMPITAPEQEKMVREMECVDIYVMGNTFEAELAFAAVMQRFADVRAVAGMFDEPIDGNVWVDPKTREFVRGKPLPRIAHLDEIPSAYLTGHMDKFFSSKSFARMQIARGCPFTCQFCNSAVQSNNRINRYSFERLKAELDYIVQRINITSPLEFADDNFGMYREDEEIADYLGYLIKTYDWPKHIRGTTGKNKSDRIIRVLEKLQGRMPMTASVQSLDPTVLENIQRSNIKLDTYRQIQANLVEMGMQAYAELIICLPGESFESIMQAIDTLLESGVKYVAANQLNLLPGTPIATPEQRERYQFVTRHRVVAYRLGDYGLGRIAVETDEIVVETPDFSFEEYLEFRIFHLILTVYHHQGAFEEAFHLAREQGLRPFQILRHMQQTLDKAPAPFRQTILDFRRDNQAELFDSAEACIAWARENYEALINGGLGVGSNLLQSYAMKARYFCFEEALTFLHRSLVDLIGPSNSRALDQLEAIIAYYRAVCLHVPFAKTLDSKPTWRSTYAIEQWREEGYSKPLQTYALEHEETFSTEVDPALRDVILSRIGLFGETPMGLGRQLRTWYANKLRRRIFAEAKAAA